MSAKKRKRSHAARFVQISRFDELPENDRFDWHSHVKKFSQLLEARKAGVPMC